MLPQGSGAVWHSPVRWAHVRATHKQGSKSLDRILGTRRAAEVRVIVGCACCAILIAACGGSESSQSSSHGRSKTISSPIAPARSGSSSTSPRDNPAYVCPPGLKELSIGGSYPPGSTAEQLLVRSANSSLNAQELAINHLTADEIKAALENGKAEIYTGVELEKALSEMPAGQAISPVAWLKQHGVKGVGLQTEITPQDGGVHAEFINC